MKPFLPVFLLIQLILFAAELARPVQEALIEPFTAAVAGLAAWVVRFFDPTVLAQNNLLVDPRGDFAVAIEAGCNGVEAVIVLTAAMLAMPKVPWRWRLGGILAGFLAIQGLNLVRIISLFYLGQWNRQAFEWAHLYLWQALIMLDVLVVFLIWLRRLPAPEPAGER